MEKIVFLLGAGTSKSAGIPLAGDIVKQCLQAFGEAVIRHEVDKIRRKQLKSDGSTPEDIEKDPYLLSRPSFEEVLTAYKNLVGEEELIQLMRKSFLVTDSDIESKKRTLVTLFNECLAHLAREHLVDFIVSLNFDELLEFSLNEDIGAHAYVHVTNSARFQWALTHGLTRKPVLGYDDPDQRNDESGCEQSKVWLLKPHGTISHENTLRNLSGHVWRFEPEKSAVLKRVFANAHIIVIGYSLTAQDLQNILITHALAGSIKSIYWIDPCKRCDGMGQYLRNMINRDNKKSFYHIRLDADQFISRLFKKLYSPEMIRKDSILLPPYRHFLRAYLFQIIQKDAVPSTFGNRLIAEMINYGVRMKGWFSSRVIGKSHQMRNLLDNATSGQRESLYGLIDDIAPAFASFIRPKRSERIFIFRRQIDINLANSKKRDLFNRIAACIPESICSSLLPKKKPDIPKSDDLASLTRYMGELLLYFHHVSTYNMNEDLGTFRNAIIIPNRTVLNTLTNWIIEKNRLHIVCETGYWFLNPPEKAYDKLDKIEMVVIGDYEKLLTQIKDSHKTWATDLCLADIESASAEVLSVKKYLNTKCKTLPTFRNRFHFTFCLENEKCFGIFFNRLDRQVGTTFYWIEIDLKNPDEKEQFAALNKYLKGQA